MIGFSFAVRGPYMSARVELSTSVRRFGYYRRTMPVYSIGVGLLYIAVIPIVFALAPGTARAYENQVTLGLGGGYAYRFTDESPTHGAALELNTSLGLNDVWTLKWLASYAIYPSGKSLQSVLSGIEIIYLVDILEIVPQFGIGIDGVGSIKDKRLSLDWGGHTIVGLDYLFSRKFFLSLEARPFIFFSSFRTQAGYLSITCTTNIIFDM